MLVDPKPFNDLSKKIPVIRKSGAAILNCFDLIWFLNEEKKINETYFHVLSDDQKPRIYVFTNFLYKKINADDLTCSFLT